MSTAIEEVRAWMQEAENDFNVAMSKGGADFFAFDESLKRAARYATIAQAEAAERQAAALERANELAEKRNVWLRRIARILDDTAGNCTSVDDDEATTFYGDDQRTEDDAGYNADIGDALRRFGE